MKSSIIVTSPYPQFTKNVDFLKCNYDFNIKIIEAVLEDAVEYVCEELDKENYEGVVSRGGTAAAIKKNVDVPVITAEHSDFDLLKAIEKAKVLGKKIAYLCYTHKEIYELEELKDILQIEVKPYFYTNSSELERAIEKACQDGIEVTVGGSAWGKAFSEAMGMKCVIIFSTKRTVYHALERAKEIVYTRQKDRENYGRISTLVQSVNDGIILINANKKLLLINEKAKKFLKLKNDNIEEPIFSKLLSLPKGTTSNLKLEGSTLVVNKVEVRHKKEFFGEVFTLQKISHFQQMEMKIRKDLHKKGFIAKHVMSEIISSDKIMQQTIEKAKYFAKVDSTLLIRGESGVGKELFAQGVHNESLRRNGPFVAINCAALPKDLLETELFGYDEGAFTGAKKNGKMGVFELAHMGTIFLDEVGSIPFSLQARLLRVLEEREIMRVGGDKVIPVNVRIIAATNENLQKLVTNKEFRHDLYFRINVLNLSIPPLRTRKKDILILADYFIKKFSEKFKKEACRLPTDLKRWMKNYDWPGNVRELENFIERVVLLSDNCNVDSELVKNVTNEANEILLSESVTQESQVWVKLSTLEDMEKQLIKEVERKMGNNKSKLAKTLGISRTTLWKKINGTQ